MTAGIVGRRFGIVVVVSSVGLALAFQGCANDGGQFGENLGEVTQAATTAINVPWGTMFGNTPILAESTRQYTPIGDNAENTLLTIPANGVGCGANAPNGIFLFENGKTAGTLVSDSLNCAVSGANCASVSTGFNFNQNGPANTETWGSSWDQNLTRLRDGSFLYSAGSVRYSPTQAACANGVPPNDPSCRWGMWQFFRSNVCSPTNWTKVSEIDRGPIPALSGGSVSCPKSDLDGGLTYADPWSNRIFFIVPTWRSPSCTPDGGDRFYVSTNNGTSWTYVDTFPFSHNYALTTLPNGAIYLFAAGNKTPTPKLIRIDPNYNWASTTSTTDDLPYTSANVTPADWNVSGIQHTWGVGRIGIFPDGSERVRLFWPEVSAGRQKIHTTVVQAVGGGSGVTFTDLSTYSKLYSASGNGSLLEATMTETDRMEMTGAQGSPSENVALLSFLEVEKIPTAKGDVNFGKVILSGAMARGSDFTDMITLSLYRIAFDHLDGIGEYNWGSFWYDRVSRKLNFMSQFKTWDSVPKVSSLRTHVTSFGPLTLFTNFVQPLAGQTNDAPAIATTSTATTRLGLYTTGGVDRQLYNATKLGTGAWSAFAALGSPPGGIKGSPAAIYRGGSVSLRDVFVRDSSDREWHKPYYNSAWQAWELLPQNGTLTSDLAATSWGTDRIDLVARGGDGAIWHRAWDSTGWTSWHSLGGWFIQQTPAVVSWGVNRVDVFGVGGDGHVYHASCSSSCKTAADFSGWGDDQGGNFTGGLTASSPGPNRLDVFAKGQASGSFKTFHKAWDPAIGGWTTWLALPMSDTPLGDRAGAAAGSDGTTYVVQQGPNSSVVMANSVTP